MSEIPIPPAHRPDMEVIPIDPMSDSKLYDVAYNVAALLQSRGNREFLQQTNRHRDVMKFAKSAEAGTAELQRYKVSSQVRAFAVRHAGLTLGIARIEEDKRLNTQASAIPAFVARKLGLSIPYENVPLYRADAWIAPGRTGQWGLDTMLTVVYEKLQAITPDSYVVESLSSPPEMHAAITHAGFLAVGEPGRYDEFERSGIPPLSQLYLSRVSAQLRR